MESGIKQSRLRQWTAGCSFGLLLILLCGAPRAVAQQVQSVPSRPDQLAARSLAPRAPVERELASGETHAYRLTLAAGDYLRVEVAERGIDVVVMLFDPAGQKIAESNVVISRLEAVSLIAETAGEFRLEVRPADGTDKATAAGRYEVKIAEQRAATAQDQERVRAERAFEAGKKLHLQRTTETYRGAARKYEEARALYQAVSDRLGEAFALYHLGMAYYWLNDRRKSLDYLRQALPLVEALGERKTEAWTLVEIGSACDALGEKQQALTAYQRALSLLRELGERYYEGYTLASIAQVYGSMGDRQQSIAYLEQALVIQRSIGAQGGEASSLAVLGNAYETLGEKQKALEYLHQALPLLHATGNGEAEAHTLYTIGLIYDSLNERQKAVEYFNQALALRKVVGHRRGQAALWHELGNIYEGLGEHAQALTYYQQGLALYEEQKNYSGAARLLRNIGQVYDTLGEKQKSAEFYKRALPLFRLGSDRQTYARLLANLGKVLSESGEHKEALVHLNEARTLFQQFSSRFFEVYTLYWLARSERGSGNLTAARARIEEALGKIERLRGDFYQPELRAAGFTKAQDFYELEIDLLLRLAESQADKTLISAALSASEYARARTMLDLLAEARIEIRQGISAELKQREQATQAHFSALQSQLIQVHQQPKPDQRQLAALQVELKQADEERETLEREIRRQYPHYAEMLYPTPLRADAVRGLLDEQTALLEYTLGQENSFLFVVTRESISSFRLPKAAEIGQLVQELREALKTPGRREFSLYTRAAERLYQTLVAPAAGALSGKQRLLIAPDGVLHYLPFEALLVKNTQAARAPEYLLKRWTVSYVPSASVLASLRQNTRPAADKAGKQFLAFADPVYGAGVQSEAVATVRGLFDNEAHWELARLAQSQREASEIARLYRPEQVALYLGADAKEENVKGNPALASARRLHFATHGLLNERQPQYSGLVLTLDDDPREDGLLQVYEIFNLKLQAELVVLSACQTGLGQELKGEGIIGLTRAFMYAGAPSVVVSLWQVADASTAELMVKFYQQLERAADKAEALRRAKLELMQNPRYAHPYYWASFVLVGEPK